VVGMPHPGRSVDLGLGWEKQLDWVSIRRVRHPPPIGEREGQPCRWYPRLLAVIDPNGGVVGVESFTGSGPSRAAYTGDAFWNEVFGGTWSLPRPAEARRYSMDAASAKKKTTTKRMNSAMPAQRSTGLHIASLAPRRPSCSTAAFRTIHVHRSDR